MERQIAVTDSPKWREKHQTRAMKLCFGLVLLLVTAPATARDNGQWTSSPTHVRQWFQRLMQPHGIIFISTTGDVYCYVTPGGV